MLSTSWVLFLTIRRSIESTRMHLGKGNYRKFTRKTRLIPSWGFSRTWVCFNIWPVQRDLNSHSCAVFKLAHRCVGSDLAITWLYFLRLRSSQLHYERTKLHIRLVGIFINRFSCNNRIKLSVVQKMASTLFSLELYVINMLVEKPLTSGPETNSEIKHSM